nr:uncharacterized protein LOC129430031 isoform X1 [Misgurnus anguillicaudatus]
MLFRVQVLSFAGCFERWSAGCFRFCPLQVVSAGGLQIFSGFVLCRLFREVVCRLFRLRFCLLQVVSAGGLQIVSGFVLCRLFRLVVCRFFQVLSFAGCFGWWSAGCFGFRFCLLQVVSAGGLQIVSGFVLCRLFRLVVCRLFQVQVLSFAGCFSWWSADCFRFRFCPLQVVSAGGLQIVSGFVLCRLFRLVVCGFHIHLSLFRSLVHLLCCFVGLYDCFMQVLSFMAVVLLCFVFSVSGSSAFMFFRFYSFVLRYFSDPVTSALSPDPPYKQLTAELQYCSFYQQHFPLKQTYIHISTNVYQLAYIT